MKIHVDINTGIEEFLLWHNVGGVSATPRCRFNPSPAWLMGPVLPQLWCRSPLLLRSDSQHGNSICHWTVRKERKKNMDRQIQREADRQTEADRQIDRYRYRYTYLNRDYIDTNIYIDIPFTMGNPKYLSTFATCSQNYLPVELSPMGLHMCLYRTWNG